MYTHAHKLGPQRPCTRGIFQIYGRPKVAENAEIYAENGPFWGIFRSVLRRALPEFKIVNKYVHGGHTFPSLGGVGTKLGSQVSGAIEHFRG